MFGVGGGSPVGINGVIIGGGEASALPGVPGPGVAGSEITEGPGVAGGGPGGGPSAVDICRWDWTVLCEALLKLDEAVAYRVVRAVLIPSATVLLSCSCSCRYGALFQDARPLEMSTCFRPSCSCTLRKRILGLVTSRRCLRSTSYLGYAVRWLNGTCVECWGRTMPDWSGHTQSARKYPAISVKLEML